MDDIVERAGGPPRADPLVVPPPAFPDSEVRAIAERSYGLSPTTLSPLDSERDQNVKVEDVSGRAFVLKISNTADDRAVVEMQTEAILHIGRRDPSLPVMRVIPTTDGAPWAEAEGPDGRTHLVRLFTFLEGRNAKASELDADAFRAFGETTARLGRALRGFFHPAAGYEILWDIEQAPRLRPLLPHITDADDRAVVERVLDRFDERVAPALGGLRAQVIHNDMNLHNTLVDERGRVTGITDFGDMTHAALVCDLAVAVADVLEGRADALELVEPMVQGFVSVTPLEDEEAELLADLVATRLAATVAITAWRLGMYPELGGYISVWEEGAWRFLRLLEGLGVETSSALLRDAGGRPPPTGGRRIPSQELLERRGNVLGPALSPMFFDRPLHIVRAEGVWMFDVEGRRYLDAYNNVPVVGHGHPRIVEAIAEQSRRLNTNTRYLHETVVELAERIVATMPAGLDTVMFVNSGSEANDLAWRLATTATVHGGAIVSGNAYHGVTEATAALSPEEWPAGERPSHVETVPAPDANRGPDGAADQAASRSAAHVTRAAAALAERGAPLAAMLVDPAFTSDGIHVPPPEYLREVLRLVHEAGGLLVADEVQAGHGRLGTHLWSFQASGIAPDLVTMGKPMGNGHPVAAVVTRRGVAEAHARKAHLFSTFGGNPVSCAAALAVLEVIEEEGLQRNAEAVGAYLAGRLEALKERHERIGDVRGKGLLIGVELVRDRATREPAPELTDEVLNGMKDRGVLVGSTGPHGNVLKIRPPLSFTREHADLLATTFDRTLGSLG